ncbi:unnamed protein product [Protopolystoma xenopodis]|uniref:Uncharacterized protein n=1 Tax=Protopolystoma xenopodis TaxID=117903 RepID=A0A3S5AR60_9PLAT|nr:unnamed protein product [Protopolystoma xenopodis]
MSMLTWAMRLLMRSRGHFITKREGAYGLNLKRPMDFAIARQQRGWVWREEEGPGDWYLFFFSRFWKTTSEPNARAAIWECRPRGYVFILN